MKQIFPLIALCLVLIACSNNNKTGEIAEDVCGCFEPVTGDMSSRTKKILVKVSKAKDPGKAMQAEMKKIDEEEQADVLAEIKVLSALGSNTSVGKCMKKLEKKYKNFKVDDSNQEMAGKIADEMADVDNCEAAAALLKIFSKSEDSSDGEDSNKEEEQNEE